MSLDNNLKLKKLQQHPMSRKNNSFVIRFDHESNVVILNGDTVLNTYQIDSLLGDLQRRFRTAWVYLVKMNHPITGELCHKIGMAIDVKKRRDQLNAKPVHQIKCLYVDRSSLEKHLHRYFIEQGKWIDHEFFNLTQEDVDLFCSNNAYEDIKKNYPLFINWEAFLQYNPLQRIEDYDYPRMKAQGYFSLVEYYRTTHHNWAIKKRED